MKKPITLQQSLRKQNGLSLVEIMVAVAISLVLVAGVLEIFASSKRTYRVQDALSRVQENGRFAMDFLSRSLRMAGYLGCFSDVDNIVNTLNDPDAYEYNFDETLTGTNNDGLNLSDTITIRGPADGNLIGIDEPYMPDTSADIKSFPADPPPLGTGDIVAVSDCVNAAVFQITNYTDSNGNIVHNIGGSSVPGNATKDLGNRFAGDASIVKLTTTKYYLDEGTGSGNPPTLFRQVGGGAAEELVEGVENMQIQYGEDTDNDRIANTYVDSDAVADMNKVVSLRIALLMRTIEDNIATEPQDYTYLGVTTTPGDKRLRRVFSSVIKMRNKGLVK